MAYDGREIANFILDFCESNKRSVTNLALQKLVYFCHVWSLVRFNKPLIRHKFEAWEFGPVLPYLYREFKHFDRSPINGRAKRLDPLTGKSRLVAYSFDEETCRLLRETVEFYSRIGTKHLVELSHVEGGPWFNVWYHEATVNPGMAIEDDTIQNYYSKIPSPFTVH